MHDPSTVAHQIKYPWAKSVSIFKDGTKHRYRASIITIWHEDPMDFAGKVRGRSDDSCGWHTPHMRKDELERWKKHAEYQYGEIFRKTKVTAAGESYAYVCYDAPDCYTAVYWLWRAIKHEHRKDTWSYRQPWQYGNTPTPGELEAIMNLATNPVDNLQFCFTREAKRPIGTSDSTGDDFWSFYSSVHRAYRRHHRPWWHHPRWHVHHWRIQFHPWQTFRRWAFSRCTSCGKRFSWGYSPTGFQWDKPRPKLFRGESDVYHSDCANKVSDLMRSPTEGSA